MIYFAKRLLKFRLLKEWNYFCKNNRYIYLAYLLGFQRIVKYILKFDIMRTILLRKKRFLLIYNLFNCEAHRDTILNILRNMLYI